MERYNNMIHDALSNLRQKMKSFSIYVSGTSCDNYVIMAKEDARKLLPRLYDEGFVQGTCIMGIAGFDLVSLCNLLFYGLRSLSSHLAPNSLWSGATTNDVITGVAGTHINKRSQIMDNMIRIHFDKE